jgi:hypothetical protein
MSWEGFKFLRGLPRHDGFVGTKKPGPTRCPTNFYMECTGQAAYIQKSRFKNFDLAAGPTEKFAGQQQSRPVPQKN